jgi:hypothetical protein
VAALTILDQPETPELSLQQHLDLAPDLVGYGDQLVTGDDPQSLMMAQPVPHQDKKRVKVYELRNNDWFDRGTGFCTAKFATVCLLLLPLFFFFFASLHHPCLWPLVSPRFAHSAFASVSPPPPFFHFHALFDSLSYSPIS